MTTNNEIIDLLRDVSGKLDGAVERIGKLETAVAVDVAVSAQTRDKIDERIAAIERTLANDIRPPVEDFRRMRAIGISIVGVVALGGTAFGASLIWWGEWLSTTIRAWLRIP